MTGDSSTKKFLGWAAVLIGVPAAVLALLQISDRFGDSQPTSPIPPTPSTPIRSSTPASSPDPSPTTSWSTTDDPVTPRADSPTPVQQPPPMTPESLPPLVVNRIDIETYGYDEVEPDVYLPDNNGGTSIRVSWTSTADGYEVPCKSSVRITGPGTDLAEPSVNCSDSMGTWFDVDQSGTFNVTVTTHQDSGAEYSYSIPVTIR